MLLYQTFSERLRPIPLVFLFTLMVSSISIRNGVAQWEGREEQLAAVEKAFGDPPDSQRLTPRDRVWVDRKNHRVIADGYVAMQEGQLEMFACPAFTKEHESVVALFSKSSTIHAGLLAVGAQSGRPVQWEPEYRPPSGSEIQIQALWFDRDGRKQSADARTWIRQVGSEGKHLEPNWVFAGSGFWEDPETKKRHYLAESGDLICVSNFSTATLDIPLKSTDANSGLMFVAFSERVPDSGTPVRLVLQVIEPKKPEPKKPDSQKTETKSDESAPSPEKSKSESEASQSESPKPEPAEVQPKGVSANPAG